LNFLKRYLLPRLLVYFLVIFLGITLIFIIPRLMPTDPVQEMINTITSQGAYLDPEAIKKLEDTLRELYGLKGSLWEQYINLWKRLFKGDFGPSFFQFPTPVIDLIKQSLPWTLGLLTITTITSWVLGLILGGFVGYFYKKKWAKLIDGIAMVIRPIPYYILALTLLILFAYIFPIFPIGGGASIGRTFQFNWCFIWSVIKHGFLPAMSLIIIGTAVWLQTTRLIVQNILAEDFVIYAKSAGLRERKIALRYTIRNAMLPQITGLTLSLGQIFSGALITEVVYSYPGLGTLAYNAINSGDYNLLMGITTISIIAIATGMLVIDLIYPFFDPRIRYR